MRYLGGKQKAAGSLVAAMAPTLRGRVLWDAFCGGLNVAGKAAEVCQVIASDRDPALIALHRAVHSGWDPPASVTEDEFLAARSLPDSDPRKAFAAFGCSFGGKWGSAYARGEGRNYAAESARSLTRDARRCAVILQLDFMTVQPFFDPSLVIYCDPPYRGTTGYRLGAFDSDAFWTRAAEWAALGVPVFVSEFSAPQGWSVVWTRVQKARMARKKDVEAVMVEKLFYRGPSVCNT